MQEWTEEVLESNKTFLFFMYVYILWQGQKAVLTIVKFDFVDIFYSKFFICSIFVLKIGFFAVTWAANE